MKKKEDKNKKIDIENLSPEEIKKEKERIRLESEKKLRSKKRERALKLGVLIILLFLIILYFILAIWFSGGAFTISLDQNFAKKTGIVIYDNSQTKESKRVLKAKRIKDMDNIAEEWIPRNIDSIAEGSHNGENYLAYTFYIFNQGQDVLDYWYSILIDDVIRRVDEAIRIKIFLNGKPITYAKIGKNGKPEPNTKPFYSDKMVMVENRKGLKPGERDKMTILVWIDGPDPDCVDYLVGGEMKMHMEITEEQNKTGNRIVRPNWLER